MKLKLSFIFLLISTFAFGQIIKKQIYDNVVSIWDHRILEEAAEIQNGKLEKEYYGNDDFKFSYTIKDGKLNGPFLHYRTNNIILVEGSYVNDKLQGAYKKYYPSKQLEIDATFDKGTVLPGIKAYHENGKVRISETFDEEKKVRIAKEYTEDGFLLFSIEYVLNEDNLVDGKITRYNEDGSIWWKGTYKNSKNFGKQLSFHKNGQLSEERFFNEKGQKHGTYKSYYKNGTLWSETVYVNDKKQDKEIVYHKNGTIKEVSTYNEDGRAHGTHSEYYDNEQLFSETNYVNGMQEGLEIYYGENGKIAIKGSYKENKSVGEHTHFYKNGNKKKTIVYTDEGESIEMLEYNEEGILTDSSKDIDEKTTIQKEYFPNGQVKEAVTFVNEILNGEYLIFYDNGKLCHKLLYKNGKLLENVVCYDRNGKEVDKGTYANGNGTVKFYNNQGKLKKEIIYKNNRSVDVNYFDED